MNQKGFTLLELMVTLAVMGVMAAFALPAMNQFMENQRIRSTMSNYTNGLTFARNEAIRQNVPVIVCGANISVDGQLTRNSCQPNWNQGVFIFVDTNGDNAYTANTDINLRVVQSPNKAGEAAKVGLGVAAYPIAGANAVNDFRIQYLPNGQVALLTGNNYTTRTVAANYMRFQFTAGDNNKYQVNALLDPMGQIIKCSKQIKESNTSNDVARLCTNTVSSS